jgi:hypothetical protein
MAGAEQSGGAGSAGRVALRARRLATLAPSAALVALSATGWAQSARQAQEAATEAIRRLDLQTEFPHGPEPLNWNLKLPPEVMWIVIAIAVGILLYAFRDLIPIWRGGRNGVWTEDETGLDGARPQAAKLMLGAADALAAEGRFAEAMHMLLLEGLAHMRQRLDEPFADSLTSREIVQRTNLPAEARAALRDVVARVEFTYFGEYPAAAADYAACRVSFDALAQALYGAAA